MAGGINKVIIIGNLGKDPELRYTQGGTAVCQLSVATTRTYLKQEQKVEETEWHRVVVWGKTAEHCGQYLTKGRQVYVGGRLQTRSWDDKDGNKRYTTEVVADTVQFLGGRPGGEQRSESRSEPRSQRGATTSDQAGAPADDAWGGGYKDMGPDDDIPF